MGKPPLNQHQPSLQPTRHPLKGCPALEVYGGWQVPAPQLSPEERVPQQDCWRDGRRVLCPGATTSAADWRQGTRASVKKAQEELIQDATRQL